MLVNMSGGKKVENIINEIVEPVLLWTNAVPTDSFGAQNISLDMAEYDGFLFEARLTNSDATSNICFLKKGVTGVVFASNAINYPGQNLVNTYYRTVTFNDSGVRFSTSYRTQSTATGAFYAIPTRIWGVKYTL